MLSLVVVSREGQETSLNGKLGLSVLQIMRGAGMNELEALCGGSCACATCHVYIDDDWLGKVGSMSEDEEDLLETLDGRNEKSRLACQIRLSDVLDGLRLTVAPED